MEAVCVGTSSPGDVGSYFYRKQVLDNICFPDGITFMEAGGSTGQENWAEKTHEGGGEERSHS